jgi:hypothetical protein
LGTRQPREGTARPSVPHRHDPTTLISFQWQLLRQHMVKLKQKISWRGSKPMRMGPWIHGLFIMTIDQTDLDQHFLLDLERLPWIVDVAKCQGGTGWGRVEPAYRPKWPCHVHLLLWSMYVTILGYFCHISCIHIILQVQVELGEL